MINNKMNKNILLLSSGDIHGAYEIVYRISKYLGEAEYNVALVVRKKTKSDSFIIHLPVPIPQRTITHKIKNRLRKLFQIPKNFPVFDSDYVFLPNEDESIQLISAAAILAKISFIPDLIIVGMTDGFINTTTLTELKIQTKAKIVLFMVDMFALTGGCHFVKECKGFEDDCSNCPAILNSQHKNWPKENLKKKMDNIQKSNIHILAGSGWTYEQARKSALFRNQKEIYNINSCIDTRLFNNKHRGYAKNIFEIPVDSKLIFFGSKILQNTHKGIVYFIEALNNLWDSIDTGLRTRVNIIIAGNDNTENELTKQIPFKKHLIEYIKDYRLLSLAYQASDVLVCPSIEDGGPLMVSEALACGTPVVGFKMGVLYNLVINDYNGYVAEMKNSKDLAFGINKILTLTDDEFYCYSQNAISMIEQNSSRYTLVKTIEQILIDPLI
jgi:glycosyltransferase involved in cell wall biosynthesis